MTNRETGGVNDPVLPCVERYSGEWDFSHTGATAGGSSENDDGDGDDVAERSSWDLS